VIAMGRLESVERNYLSIVQHGATDVFKFSGSIAVVPATNLAQ